ncbi:MAG: NAD-dependent epimerase/dehydratase family protein [Gemmatimonadota bacterium]
MGARILLTGAAGFVGSHLAEELLERGDSVVGVDNFDPFYSPAEKRANLERARGHSSFSLLEVDCADSEALDRALGPESFDAVVHLAAKAGVRPSIAHPFEYARANLLGTQAILEAARERGVGRIVFGSSSSVYGDNGKVPFSEDDPVERPISPYAATKRGGELLCHAHQHLHGGSVLALRYFTVYGPRQRPDLAIRKFAELMLRGEPIPVFGDGSSARDYTWVGDIVAGTVAALDYTEAAQAGFDILNLGGNRTTSLSRLIELIGEAVGAAPSISRLDAQPGDVRRTHADIDKAARLLGYAPRVGVEEGVPRMVEWLRERRPAQP